MLQEETHTYTCTIDKSWLITNTYTIDEPDMLHEETHTCTIEINHICGLLHLPYHRNHSAGDPHPPSVEGSVSRAASPLVSSLSWSVQLAEAHTQRGRQWTSQTGECSSSSQEHEVGFSSGETSDSANTSQPVIIDNEKPTTTMSCN